MMTTPDHTTIARQIYRDLCDKPHGTVDWQICDRYCLSASDFKAVNAKRTGLKRGVPDMFLPVPAGDWHGLFLELKRAEGTPSDLKPEQADWLRRLQDHGYQTVVAYGWKAAVAEISAYLAISRDIRKCEL